MHPRSRLLPTALLAGALALPAGALALPAAASAADAPSACTLMAPRTAKEYALPGTGLVARDPYGGLLSRNRLFFHFSVKGPQSELAKVAKVQWALDGTVVREDPTTPFEWKRPSGLKSMPAGDHTVTVTVVPTAGEPASTQFALTATDCQPVSFYAEVPKRAGIAGFTWQSAFEAVGEPLRSVRVTGSSNVAAALPARLRGRKIGTVSIFGSASLRGGKTYNLTAPRGASRTLLTRGNLRVVYRPGGIGFLDVRGLPAGTQGVRVRFSPGIVQVRSASKAFDVAGTFTAASGVAVQTSGGRYA